MVFWRDKRGHEILLNRVRVFVGTADDGIVDPLCLAGYHLLAKSSYQSPRRLARRESDLPQVPHQAFSLKCAAEQHPDLRVTAQ